MTCGRRGRRSTSSDFCRGSFKSCCQADDVLADRISQRVQVPNNLVLGFGVIMIVVQVLDKHLMIRYLDPRDLAGSEAIGLSVVKPDKNFCVVWDWPGSYSCWYPSLMLGYIGRQKMLVRLLMEVLS